MRVSEATLAHIEDTCVAPPGDTATLGVERTEEKREREERRDSACVSRFVVRLEEEKCSRGRHVTLLICILILF